MRAKVTAFFNSPLIQNVIQLFTCLKALRGAAANFISLAEAFAQKVVDIANFPAGWIKIIIGLICNWSNFKAAVDYLVRGIQASDAAVKWNLFGRFAGKLIDTIARA